jgi:signal transduction histidine kinase
VCLQQVVLNLLMNAMDAMDQVTTEDRRLIVQTRRVGDAVEVAVSDTGPGIPPERLPQLFEAFFTTKKDGLGLGLAIARSLVEAHGGRIWADAPGERGATFRLTLPGLPSP